MTVLWVVAILSLAIFTATQFLYKELESSSNADAFFRAEQHADRGVAIAAHPDVRQGDPLLSRQIDSVSAFSARIESEGSRLNLNALLNPDDRIVLEELFYQWGLRSDDAARVVAHLIDWVDTDNTPSPNGAEASFYANLERFHHPPNRPLRDLDEALLVSGFDLVAAANPQWRDSFTILSSGPLDITWAPPELLAAACQSPLEAARLFVTTRNGPDGMPGTPDDYPFTGVDEAIDLLVVPENLQDTVGKRLATEDPVRRIVSTGQYGSMRVERSVTLRYSGRIGTILRWSTRQLP